MSRTDWRTISPDSIGLDAGELESQLAPLLARGELSDASALAAYGERLVTECRAALGRLFPYSANEREFLDRLLDQGDLEPSLLTDDASLVSRIASHPALLWKAKNVREYRRP